MNDVDQSKKILINLIDEYSEIITLKNNLSEVYFLLGEIFLKVDQDIIEAELNFENSKSLSSKSEFGKKSEEYIKYIVDYTVLLEEIKYTKNKNRVKRSDLIIIKPDTKKLILLEKPGLSEPKIFITIIK